jgi:hypothetical protein
MSLINNFLLDDPTPCRLLNREEATRWWWNDSYWPTPWMFGLLMTFLFMAGCIGMGGATYRLPCPLRVDAVEKDLSMSPARNYRISGASPARGALARAYCGFLAPKSSATNKNTDT